MKFKTWFFTIWCDRMLKMSQEIKKEIKKQNKKSKKKDHLELNAK